MRRSSTTGRWFRRLLGKTAAVAPSRVRSRRLRTTNPRSEAPLAPSRRRLLQAAPALVGLGAYAAARPAAALAAGKRASTRPGGRRWGMVIDLDRCAGCGACTVACREENNVPTYGPNSKFDRGRIEWMSMMWQPQEQGGKPQLLPFPCQHCANPPCVKVCPVGATYKDSDGITFQIWERCIGCRYCMVACPYSRRSFNWAEPEWDGTMIQMLNPDVATRPEGVVEKCLFCHHRIKRLFEDAAAAGREVTDRDLQRLTACAAACPAQAITFGDLEDPRSLVAELSESPRAFRLLDHIGTEPNVLYLKRDRR